MDNRAIGFFDSGLGGLTCIAPLAKLLPEEKVIYFGDTARTPYGSKAPATIKSFSMQIADFLVSNDVKMLVIACNTISATCLDDLRERYPDIPIIGIITPAAERVARVTSMGNHIGIIGTKVTIASGAYEKALHELNPDLSISSVACPAFVPLIEEGIINSDIMDLTIRYYMEDFVLENRIDTMVLGCTHYPLIKSSIERIFPDIKIVNPSEEIVFAIRDELFKRDMQAQGSTLTNTFYASDLSENFIRMIESITSGSDVEVKFKNLELPESSKK
jgi:glutamate racemase